MKRTLTMAAGVAAALGLGLAASTFAHGPMGGPMGGGGPGFFGGGGGGYGCAQGAGPMSQLFTAEEHTAFHEQMRNATTPEQRQALMEAHRAEMQKRAAEKGITLPDRPGRGGPGMRGWMHN
jgi:Spy/CpxP family protein refolding chaperone